MELADLAFGEREHRHAGEAHALIDAGDVFLIAREPVQRFRQDDIDPTGERLLDQRLHTGSQDERTARDGVVGMYADDRPAFFLRALAADADLILDRGFALVV
nr:hypothetical protein [Falsiroseomonas frigidaquae]